MDIQDSPDFPDAKFIPALYNPVEISARQAAADIARYQDEFIYGTAHTCPDKILAEIKELIDVLSFDSLLILFQQSIGSPHQRIQQVINCILDSMVRQRVDKPIRQLVSQLTTLAKGAYGQVYLAGNENVPLFVVKRLIRDTNLMYREAKIGLLLNRLRSYTPGFALTYQIYVDKDVVQKPDDKFYWDLQYSLKPFLFIEAIPNSTTLQYYIRSKNGTFVEFVCIFLQIFSALNVAYTTMGFTHHDLHYSNVVVQHLKEKVWVPIYYGGNTYFMLTDKIARIIDFGRANIYDVDAKSAIPGNTYPDLSMNFCPFPLDDFSVLMNTCHYGVRKTAFNDAQEQDKILNFMRNIYHQLLGRDLKNDARYLWKKFSVRVEDIKSKRRLGERIRIIDDGIRAAEREIHRLRPLLLVRGGSRSARANNTRYLAQNEAEFARLTKEREQYLTDYNKINAEDTLDVVYNGALLYTASRGRVTHNDIIAAMFDLVGTDFFQGIVCSDMEYVLADPHEKTVCLDQCLDWRYYRERLFGQ